MLNFNKKIKKEDVIATVEFYRDSGIHCRLEMLLIAARFNAGTQRKSDAKRFSKLLLLDIANKKVVVVGASLSIEVVKECKRVLKKEWN